MKQAEHLRSRTLLGLVAVFVFSGCQVTLPSQPSVVLSEFLFDTAPFPSVHASTVVETESGLVAAWFGGTREGADDVGIWLSRREENGWSVPKEVATGVQVDGTRFPCWNPVLFVMPDGAMNLFYKVGPSPRSWWGEVRSSADGGLSWSNAERLPDGILGPIKNKPVILDDGSILSPSSTETDERPSTWRIHFEHSSDGGRSWQIIRPAPVPAMEEHEVIQPSILFHADGRLQAVGRSRSDRIFQTWSEDNGLSWSPVTLTELPNPSAGTDAITLADSRQLLVYNHTENGRSPLNVAVSADGMNWEGAVVLENGPGEYSYPAVIQTSDGFVHITYTWRRERIRHVVIDPTLIP